jgi:hypothetical protein
MNRNNVLPIIITTGCLCVYFLLPSKRPSGKEMTRTAGVAAAHEFSRIQFERDIALAEAEADSAHEILKQTNARSEEMSAIGYANFSAEYVDEQSAALAKAANNLLQKTRRIDFLLAKAARLKIPISAR